MLKAYWGLAQLENLPAVYNAEPDRMPDDVNLDGIRTMVDASGIQVHYGATRQPTYYPAADKVMMPAYSFSNQTTTS